MPLEEEVLEPAPIEEEEDDILGTSRITVQDNF